MNRLRKYILAIQAVYIFLTALWPLVDIDSFIRVTGPKEDIWLVKTVAALLLSVSSAMFYSLTKKQVTGLVIILAVTNAVAFLCIDFWYSSVGRISSVYMLDGFVQLSFLFAWALSLIRVRRME
jgi:hypothetical protein